MSNQIPPPITSSRWGARTKRIIVIAVLAFAAFFLWNVRSVMQLLIIASLLSYLLWPLVNLIERRLLFIIPFRVRSLAVLLTFVLVFTGFGLVLVLIAPLIVGQLDEFMNNVPEVIESTEREFESILSRPINFAGTPVLVDGEPVIPLDYVQGIFDSEGNATFDPANFDVVQVIGTFAGSLGTPIFSVLGGAVNVAINVAFTLVIMFYFMKDGDRFSTHFVNVIPQSYQGDARRLLYELSRVWNAYLRGQLILSITVGLAVYTCALILGLPNAPILGLISGLLEFMPNIGPAIAMIPAVITALVSTSSTFPFLSGLSFALVVIVIWIAIQNIESIFLVPRVMGGSLDLHPVVVIIAVITGASVAGALGVILAAPFTASARMFGQYLYGKLFDIDPFPEPVRKRPQVSSRLVLFLVQSSPIRLLRSGDDAQTTNSIQQMTEDTRS